MTAFPEYVHMTFAETERVEMDMRRHGHLGEDKNASRKETERSSSCKSPILTVNIKYCYVRSLNE